MWEAAERRRDRHTPTGTWGFTWEPVQTTGIRILHVGAGVKVCGNLIAPWVGPRAGAVIATSFHASPISLEL